MMCRCLNVSASRYYDRRELPPSAHSLDNMRLSEKIRVIHAESDGVMGAPGICEEFRYYDAETRGENRVARLMSPAGL